MNQPNPTDISERFWSKVNKQPKVLSPHVTTPCWLWRGAINTTGYGRFFLNGSNPMAHRVSWLLTNGDIPEGMKVCHRCDIRNCVRPDHLFLGTDSDNVQDCIAKGRHVSIPQKGSEHGRAILDEDTVKMLLARVWKHGEKAAFARQLGVARTTISAVTNRYNWSHL